MPSKIEPVVAEKTMPSTVIPALVAASLLLITPAVAALGLRGEGESPIASQRSIHRYNFPVDVAAEARCSGTMELAGVGTVHIINSPGGNVLKEGNGVVSAIIMTPLAQTTG